MKRLTDEEIKIFESALTLPESFAEATDFVAEEAIKVDYSTQLPSSFSLGKWIYKTSNQGALWACFEENSKILMGDYSYEKIQDIHPDDVVFTYEWPARVLSVFNQWEQDTIQIKLSKLRGNKSWIKCTTDHEFFVYENGEEVIKKAGDIIPWEKLLIPIQKIDERDIEYINLEEYISGDIIKSVDWESIMKMAWKTTSKLPRKIKLTNDLIRLFWFYVAEWNINYDGWNIHWIWLTFHEEEKEYIDFCIKVLEETFPGCHIVASNKRGSKAFSIRVSNSLLGELFKNWFNHLCYHKTIPNFIYELPIERFKIFLHSLVEGDWYFTKKNDSLSREIWITITADRVINMVSNKLSFNHIPHSIEIRNNSTKTQNRADVYWIYLYWDEASWLMPEIFWAPVGTEKKDEFVSIWNVEYVVKTVTSISIADTHMVYDIEVEWNHTYCVNGIKVHNCTSLGTTHGVQILNVKKGGVEPTDRNIITPVRKDLWSKMWHSTTEYDGGDYVEKAVSTALKEWILIEENWQLAKFDAYATWEWDRTDKAIDLMKRYLYQWCPIVWCVKWNKTTWNEMSKWEIKTVPTSTTWGHCIALVGWDEWGFWFVNSWTPNDGKGLKSRFYISYNTLKAFWAKFNYRYWVLYIKEDANKDPEYLKRKNGYLAVLTLLKKYYPIENREVQLWIEAFSSAVRKYYPELNEELPK